jgi:hypothetical protein
MGQVGLFHFVWSLLDLRDNDDGNGKMNLDRKSSRTYTEILQLKGEFIHQS